MTDVSRYWEIQHHPGQYFPFIIVCKSGRSGKILYAMDFPTIQDAEAAYRALAQAEYEGNKGDVQVH